MGGEGDGPAPRGSALRVSIERRGEAGLYPGARADALYAEYAFLVAHGVDQGVLAGACSEGAARGVAPHLLLIHAGLLLPTAYLAALEGSLATLPLARSGGMTEIVDVMWALPSALFRSVEAVRARGNVEILLLPQHIDWSEPPETRRLRAERAAKGLARRQPHLSAATRFATWQLVAAPTIVGLVIGGSLAAPETTVAVMMAVAAIPFLFIVGLRLLSLLVVLRLPRPEPEPRLADADLPVYSVIVPLYREAGVVPGLVDSLRRLDYPPAKLDILLVTESVDAETQSALRKAALPPHMRIVVVADVAPRTKPKALNVALSLARGSFVVIYDAEDDPEPDQLRRAQAAFRRGPPNLMCVQGRLAMYNQHPGWLARQFMLEYAALFDAMLPALVRLRLPIPLGGTSNHFPRRALEQLGGWDAWNVTEDADLGIRIARMGGAVDVLASTTYEEAPEQPGIWLRQRTRWMKGFMQTWLVHMRAPAQLLRELGPWGFLGFNAYLGGLVLSALLHPIFLGLLMWRSTTGDFFAPPEGLLDGALLGLAAFNLVIGYASGMALAGLAASRRGLFRLLPHLALMPLYWVLISFAAYRAALQLVTNPYLWEKTPHSVRRARGH